MNKKTLKQVLELSYQEIRVDWEEKEMKCEPRVSFSYYVGNENKRASLEVRVQRIRSIDQIEELIETRDEIVKQFNAGKIDKILSSFEKWEGDSVGDFLRACQNADVDVRNEIALLNKSGQVKMWLEVEADRLSGKKKRIEEYKKGSDSYKSLMEDIKKSQERIDFWLSIRAKK